MDTITPIDVLNKVDAFYRSAWDNLVIVGTMILFTQVSHKKKQR